jgi:hypothetical protein
MTRARFCWAGDRCTFTDPERGHFPAAPWIAASEADEELGIRRSAIVVTRTVPGLDHGVWRYTYVMANVAPDAPTIRLSLSWETDEAAWVPLHGVAALTLHPDLQVAWPDLLATW